MALFETQHHGKWRSFALPFDIRFQPTPLTPTQFKDFQETGVLPVERDLYLGETVRRAGQTGVDVNLVALMSHPTHYLQETRPVESFRRRHEASWAQATQDSVDTSDMAKTTTRSELQTYGGIVGYLQHHLRQQRLQTKAVQRSEKWAIKRGKVRGVSSQDGFREIMAKGITAKALLAHRPHISKSGAKWLNLYESISHRLVMQQERVLKVLRSHEKLLSMPYDIQREVAHTQTPEFKQAYTAVQLFDDPCKRIDIRGHARAQRKTVERVAKHIAFVLPGGEFSAQDLLGAHARELKKYEQVVTNPAVLQTTAASQDKLREVVEIIREQPAYMELSMQKIISLLGLRGKWNKEGKLEHIRLKRGPFAHSLAKELLLAREKAEWASAMFARTNLTHATAENARILAKIILEGRKDAAVAHVKIHQQLLTAIQDHHALERVSNEALPTKIGTRARVQSRPLRAAAKRIVLGEADVLGLSAA